MGLSDCLAGQHSFKLGEYHQKRVDACQRRYLRAVETLARVRRLGVSPVQVNIGDKQVNIAT
jgi:hypothetical protein